ncbi:MAG: pyrroline-5-carboxylate reductase [Firmicutes bacterium]|nr:pyrroline-5-carboxylate reductase [Bacillota bacterium]
MLNINTIKIGFIGYGNMANAIAKGLVRSGAVQPDQLFAAARDYDKLCRNAAELGIQPCKDTSVLADLCDILFIAVKPYQIEGVMAPLADKLQNKIIISVAAGIYHEDLEHILPESHHLATVPNTPVSVCEGVFVCEAEHSLTADETILVQELLESISVVRFVDRDHMNIASTISGCGPAFASMFIEALGDAGCKHGLTRDTAYALAAQMLAGTGKMAIESEKHPGQLKDAVCSPGGTTIVGVSALEQHGFRYAVIDAIDQIQKK